VDSFLEGVRVAGTCILSTFGVERFSINVVGAVFRSGDSKGDLKAGKLVLEELGEDQSGVESKVRVRFKRSKEWVCIGVGLSGELGAVCVRCARQDAGPDFDGESRTGIRIR